MAERPTLIPPPILDFSSSFRYYEMETKPRQKTRCTNECKTIFLAILWVAGCVSDVVAAFSVRQEVLTSVQCEKTLQLDKKDTIRLLPSQQENGCGEEALAFDCKIYVKSRSFLSSDEELCVDYSRIQPKGENTSLLIYKGVSNRVQRTLSSTLYPLARKYMSTVSCSSRSLTLRFKSDCNGSVSERFPSWLYLYVQSKQSGHVYYLDGTCKHRKSLGRQDKLTVRSVRWKNTLGEPDVQQCSLRFNLGYFSLSRDPELCLTLRFEQAPLPCSIKIEMMKMSYLGDEVSMHLETASCVKSLRNSDFERCVDGLYLTDAMIRVQRNRTEEDRQKILDAGEEIFDMAGDVKLEDKYKTYSPRDNDFSGGSTDIDTYSSEDDSGDLGPVAKLFLALSICAAVFCCCCSVINRMYKKREEDADEPSAEPFQSQRFISRRDPLTFEERNSSPRTYQETLLMQRTTGNSQPRNARSNNSGGEISEQGREATAPLAPALDASSPPAYSDVVAPPSAPLPPSYQDLFPSQS